MEFESQVCTNIEQSKRLLVLGLKKETADMHHYQYVEGGRWNVEARPSIAGYNNRLVPAWSLHRLIEMMPNAFQDEQYRNFVLKVNSQEVAYVYNYVDDDGYGQSDSIDVDDNFYNLYDGIIAHIKWLIKKGLLNTDYLTK
jgi:hypothetical protein